MNRFIACFPLFFLLSLTSPLTAQDTQLSISEPTTSRVAPLLGFNLEYGGDEMLTILLDNGNTQKMRAGQGGSLFGGVRVDLIDKLSLDATVGIKYVTTAADNLSLRFLRFPLQGMLRYEVAGDVFVAGGVTKHVSNTFKVTEGDGIIDEGKVNLKSNLGVRFEAGWRFIGLSYTLLDYTSEEGDQEVLNANTFGVSFRYAIGR